MNQFTAAHAKAAKNTAETKTKLIVVDNAIKRWQEVMGEDVPEQMFRTAYVGIMDPLTRQHLTNFLGKDTKPESLKREILRFVNNAVPDNNSMQIGSI